MLIQNFYHNFQHFSVLNLCSKNAIFQILYGLLLALGSSLTLWVVSRIPKLSLSSTSFPLLNLHYYFFASKVDALKESLWYVSKQVHNQPQLDRFYGVSHFEFFYLSNPSSNLAIFFMKIVWTTSALLVVRKNKITQKIRMKYSCMSMSCACDEKVVKVPTKVLAISHTLVVASLIDCQRRNGVTVK